MPYGDIDTCDIPKLTDAATCFENEGFEGIKLFSAICAYADRNDGRDFVITQDGRDRAAESDMVDFSRDALGLSPMGDIYPDDKSYSASVEEQYQLYAQYLNSKGYHLVHISSGWDDFGAIVIPASRKDASCGFMAEKLPDLEYSIADAL